MLHEWGLRPLSGGRNNDVFGWGEICLKVYRKTDKDRVAREWHGLNHVAGLGLAPQPLWRDDHPDHPALGMSFVPGQPIPELANPELVLPQVAAVTRAIQALPVSEPLASWPRVDSIVHYIARLTDIWPRQLAADEGDAYTEKLRALLDRWEAGGDVDLLRRRATAVFSRGDANLLNWLCENDRLRVVDFEFSGWSDRAVDAADHIEHISARQVPDSTWRTLEDDLGVNRQNRSRFAAARRTIALRWLAVLWRRRDEREPEFLAQLDRVCALFS
ncbi:aminoglycoside phosphotransferase family protein [Amycolatopsis sp. NPDC006131]|uniref:phosphotransferase family protein n=1 Tax=Amycolatopsis sp. NPDC006131 TaxID=3156731 RepID=UPI0033A64EA1